MSASNVTTVTVLDNHTVTSGVLEVGTVWTSIGDNGSQYANDVGNGFSSGFHEATNGLLRGGRLSLASPGADEDMEDFETPVLMPTGWLTGGSHDRVWSSHNLSASSVAASLPSLPIDGDRVLLLGGGQVPLVANMSGCYATPQIDAPAVVRNHTVSFSHAADLLDGDLRWMEWRSSQSTGWLVLPPTDGYPDLNNGTFANGLDPDTSTVAAGWTSDSSAWVSESLRLDGRLTGGESWYQLRFCFATSVTSGNRSAWLLDDVRISNQGDPSGAWFHGNLSGDYAPNADGWLLMDVDLSNLTAPAEVGFLAHWDLEGGWNDGMTTLLSLDGGSNWTLLSAAPGLPGNGLVWQGSWLSQVSNEWVDIAYSLPPATFTSANASNAILAFRVLTDANVNHGGGVTDGWEGMAIDNLQVTSLPGQANQTVRRLSNFTSPPVLGVGFNLSGGNVTNEWTWTTALGAHGPTWWNASFESGQMVPRGWSIEHVRGSGWTVGSLNTTSGSGPMSWASGSSGVGIVLDGDYAAESLGYLITPTYSLPENASARFTFRSWVCTETDWDGGAVQLSIDDGATWWFPPYNALFHHGRSTLNPYSPLHTQGLFDGSIHSGGCPSRSQAFDAPSLDVSNLSGQDFRARFVFFSDTWIEKDGWYLDDVGVEVDRFLEQGTWRSSLLRAPVGDLWGVLDGHASIPPSSTLRVDLLDATGADIEGWQNLSLPVHVTLGTQAYPWLQLRVNMTTADEKTTPILERLTIGSVVHIDAQHLGTNPPSAVVVTQDGRLTLGIGAYHDIDFLEHPRCPHRAVRVVVEGVGGALQTFGGVETLVVNGTDMRVYDVAWSDLRLRPTVAARLAPGDALREVRMEVDCLASAEELRVGIDAQSHLLLDATTLGYGPHLGASTMYKAVINATDASLLWNGSSDTLTSSELDAEAVALAWWVHAAPSSNAVLVPYRTLVHLSSEGATLEVEDHLGSRSMTAMRNGTVLVDGTARCIQAVNAPHAGARQCTIALSPTTASIVGASALLSLDASDSRDIPVPLDVVDAAIEARRSLLPSAQHSLELWVSTDRGAVDVALHLESQSRLYEQIVAVPVTSWTPGQTVTVVTEHRREDPRDAAASVPALRTAMLSFGPNVGTAVGTVHVERLNEATPVFRQDAGAGFAALDATSTSSCDRTSCRIEWRLTSTWAFDDVAKLIWWTEAQDEDGFATGPVQRSMTVTGNDVENDLEVDVLIVVDDRGRQLHDWTSPLWPFEVAPETALTVTGRLRMEGLAQRFPSAHDASLLVRLEGSGWSNSTTVDVQDEGWFTANLTSPAATAVIGGASLQVGIEVQRCGPTASPSLTCELRGQVPNVTLVHDASPPTLMSVEVLDPGGRQPADGHVAPADSDVALVLMAEDDLGFASPLTVWTWLEARDDANRDGLSDENEWVAVVVPVAEGRTVVELDLPLIDAEDVIEDGGALGRIRLVVDGEDIAGQALVGGGSKTGLPLAEVRLEPRYPTSVPTERLRMDSVNGRLFPGSRHVFGFDLVDANGIESLDAFEFGLLGADETSCVVVHRPRANETTADAGCFHGAPDVTIVQTRPSTWEVEVGFRLRWDLVAGLEDGTFQPSLQVRDEGQDLGLGLRRIAPLAWTARPEVTLSLEDIVDTTAPTGGVVQDVIHVDRGDVVNVRLALFHEGTTLPAQKLPGAVNLEWSMTDGARVTGGSIDVPDDGTPELRIAFDPSVWVRTTGQFEVMVDGWSFGNLTLSWNVSIDVHAPRLDLGGVRSLAVDSDALDAVPVEVTVTDIESLIVEGVVAHWVLLRQGRAMDAAKGFQALEFVTIDGASTRHAAMLNMTPTVEFDLRSGDAWQLWFSAADASGRPLVGQGTSIEPIPVTMRWVAFEPVLSSLVAAPYRPQVGDMIDVAFEVANAGVLAGNVTVRMFDDDGQLLNEASVWLEPGERQRLVWSAEAWREGDLGLRMTLDVGAVDVPVPLADVSVASTSREGQGAAWVGLGAIAVVLAVVSLWLANAQRPSDTPPSRPAPPPFSEEE